MILFYIEIILGSIVGFIFSVLFFGECHKGGDSNEIKKMVFFDKKRNKKYKFKTVIV